MGDRLIDGLRIGAGRPHYGRYAGPDAVSLVAVEAERLGLDSVWRLERLLRAVGGERQLPDAYKVVDDPIESLTWVAARATRIRLGTFILNALFHAPVVLARRLATL
jgi:alkanesulfonate monooxygenase SsuD/methylene tetrahydromethanopterin reductase-like flavin-dependent oxidoreductase (luciferase family)